VEQETVEGTQIQLSRLIAQLVPSRLIRTVMGTVLWLALYGLVLNTGHFIARRVIAQGNLAVGLSGAMLLDGAIFAVAVLVATTVIRNLSRQVTEASVTTD
jgi:predicted transporter